MLVTINAEQGTVTLYGSTVKVFSFSQLPQIQRVLSGKVVQYVTEVTETNGDDILELVEDLAIDFVPTQPIQQPYTNYVDDDPQMNGMMPQQYGQPQQPQQRQQRRIDPSQATEKLFLHATGSGQLNLTDPILTFGGIFDFKPLDKIGYDIVNKFPAIKTLVKQGKLEIVNTQMMNEIKNQENQRLAMKDMMDTSIIVDRNAMPRYGSGYMAMPMGVGINGYPMPGMMPGMPNPFGTTNYEPLLPPGKKKVRSGILSADGSLTPRAMFNQPMNPMMYAQSQAQQMMMQQGNQPNPFEISTGIDEGVPQSEFKTDLELMMETAGMDPNKRINELPDSYDEGEDE